MARGCYRAMVMAYNIPGVTQLVLTREQIVGIYSGSINNWNDSTFAESNPGVDLPNATIVPAARRESSGSTEIFTRSLSFFSDAWAQRFGVFSKRSGWNSTVVVEYGQRTTGLADLIRRIGSPSGILRPRSEWTDVSLNRRGQSA